IVRGEPDAETRFVTDTTGTHTGDAGPVVVADHRPVRVRDADRVHIIGFTLTLGYDGVLWENSASGRLEDCTILLNGRHGLRVTNADLTVVGSVIQTNGDHGVSLGSNAVVVLDQTTIFGNADDGI